MLINVNRVSAFDLFVVSEGNFLAKIISIRYQSVVRERGRGASMSKANKVILFMRAFASPFVKVST